MTLVRNVRKRVGIGARERNSDAASCAEFVGEIGRIDRFGRESSLALYLGAATLDSSSGQRVASRRSRQVNEGHDGAEDHHRAPLEPSADLARNLVRVVWAMLKHYTDYRLLA